MPTTIGMKAGGYYDAHSSAQRAALDTFLPWLEDVMVDLPLPADRQATVAMLDIGSSEGGNAIYVARRLADKLHCLSDLTVRAFFSDLPTNDFNHLFQNLYPDGKSAFAGRNVFPCAVAGTAFGQLLPAKSLHVATTFNTIGFLEKKPDARLPHYLLPMSPSLTASRAGVSVTEGERAPFRRQAERDLQRFYEARAEELVSGGKLLVQVFGRNDAYSTSYGIYDVLSDAVLDLVDADILPQGIYEDLIFPIYFRTIDELISPLETSDRLAGVFRVEQADHRDVPVPFNLELQETGDLSSWARRYTGFLRAFTESILASALPSEAPRAETLDAIYQRVEARLRAEPARYEFHFISIAALLTRT